MPWIKQEQPHECSLPSYQDALKAKARYGDIWKCPTCKAQYQYSAVVFNESDRFDYGTMRWHKLPAVAASLSNPIKLG